MVSQFTWRNSKEADPGHTQLKYSFRSDYTTFCLTFCFLGGADDAERSQICSCPHVADESATCCLSDAVREGVGAGHRSFKLCLLFLLELSGKHSAEMNRQCENEKQKGNIQIQGIRETVFFLIIIYIAQLNKKKSRLKTCRAGLDQTL